MALQSEAVVTKPFDGQKPGTSGLRKAVNVFLQPNYTENFVQSILTAAVGDKLSGSTLVVGGDGRYFCSEAVKVIVKICAANGVARLLVGQNGILSTPAVSALIRKYQTAGGIILTASHNPGGPDGDFGIKFNVSNGGPAPDSVTDAIYKLSQSITSYRICPTLTCDIATIGSRQYQVDGHSFTVDIIDAVEDYVQLMKEIFDFNSIKSLLNDGVAGQPPLKILINCMNGVTGPYAERIFLQELGAATSSVVNSVPLPDFGGLHPDPNLTYAADLVKALQEGDQGFGAAFDGDGDRNMILGHKAFFVTPCDSLAVIAANLESIPYFQKTGVKGYARSMPTGQAVDRVAKAKDMKIFEVPTGWKYFGNLMDAGCLSLCGEESFGTGSDHIREKDGIWAVLAFLSVLASTKSSVADLLKNHWSQYGRNFFTRYDYENCDVAACDKMVDTLKDLISEPGFIGKSIAFGENSFKVAKADDFEYTDPIDGSIAKNQGIRIVFEDGSRIVYRLSGTGSSGATVRVYIEKFEAGSETHLLNAQDVLQPLVEVALHVSDLRQHTGRTKPTVIT